MRLAGKFLDKRIYVYDNQIKCEYSELITDLCKYDLLSILRSLSDLGSSIFKSNAQYVLYYNVPVTDDFLLYCALAAIKHCGNGMPVTPADLIILLRKAHYHYDQSVLQASRNPLQLLLVFAYKGFQYQEKLLNSFARSLYIYKEVWNRVVHDMTSDQLFMDTLGLRIDILAAFMLALVGSSESYHYRWTQAEIDPINQRTGLGLSTQFEERFLEWSAATYERIREYKGSLPNPLVKYPMIDTRQMPVGASSEVFLVLSKNALFFKFSYSLYYDFIEKYSAGGGSNWFKDRFGIAFQEYVGDLLRYYFNTWDVIPEVEYSKGSSKIRSVDWLLHKGKKLILLEIKQSSLFLGTKSTGSLDKFQEDVRKTIMKAVSQLNRTQEDILSKNSDELRPFEKATLFQKICVVADPIYFANMILPDVFSDMNDIHIINISDFEDLLSLQHHKESMFYVLYQKQQAAGMKAMDFKEFLLAKFGRESGRKRVRFLDEYYRNYFKEVMGHHIAP